MQKNPDKVTHDDMTELHKKTQRLMTIINGTRKHDLHEIKLEISVVSQKPRISAKYIEKWTGHYGNVPTFEYVNYVIGDKDGTWEKLIMWYERLLVRVKRINRAKFRLKHIRKRVGEEDWLWLLQVGVPSGFITEDGDIV
jgi:hypothetical protein